MKIIIVNQQTKIPISKRATKKLVIKILKILKKIRGGSSRKGKTKIANWQSFRGELTIALVDNKAIQELNFKSLGRNYPTDVICFDLSEVDSNIFDIVISTEKACENSRLFNTSLRQELKLYLIHGLLHLSGFKDNKRKDREYMQRKALYILKRV